MNFTGDKFKDEQTSKAAAKASAHHRTTTGLIPFGPFDFEPQSGALRKDGRRLKLAGKPVQILEALLEHPGEVVTREELRARLWPSIHVDFDRGLDVAVARLRGALGDSSRAPSYIETLPGKGYRFCGSLPAQDTEATPPESAPVSRSRPTVVALALVTALTLVAFIVVRTEDVPKPDLRVVVLPFDGVMSDDSTRAMADALTQSLTTRLSRLSNVHIIGRRSITSARKTEMTIPEIASSLESNYVIDGAFSRSGGRYGVSIQLFEAATDSSIWTRDYELDEKELLETQGEIVRDLALELQGHVLPEEQAALRTPPTQSPKAYGAYVKGHDRRLRYQTSRMEEHAQEAERYFREALEHDPNYVDALAEMGRLDIRRMRWAFKGGGERLIARSHANLDRALELDPGHVTALHAQSELYALAGDRDKALELARRAVQSGPEDAEARYSLAHHYGGRGFYEAALVHCDVAVRQDPLFIYAYACGVYFLYQARRLDEALQADREMRAREPTADVARPEIAFRRGDLDRAEELWKSSLMTGTVEEQRREIHLALVATLKGDVEQGQRVVERYRHVPPLQFPHFIELCAQTGYPDLAIDRVRNSHRFYNYRWAIMSEFLTPLYGEPRFEELLHELYENWRHDLAELGPTLPALPPELPSPDDVLMTREGTS